MFRFDLPIIDLRQPDDYAQGHLSGATNLPWPQIQTSLNQLPAKPADLQLLGEEAHLASATLFLQSKGYSIIQIMTVESFALFKTQHPTAITQGKDSKPLWQPTPFLLEFLDNHSVQKSATVLDVGCGGGRDAVYLSMQGFQVTAVDNKQKVIQRARQLAESNKLDIHWLCCDVDDDSCLPEQHFDFIVMVRYLNRNLVDWIKQHLNPNGYLLCQTFSQGAEKFGSPRNPKFIVKEREFSKTFSDFKIIVDRIDTLSDGRPVASFIAQKTG